jgi:methyltransferase (TIGR00027 family)
MLDRAGIPVPASLTFAPVDFEHQTLGEGLGLAGFDAGRSAFFSWLGVAQYLSNEAVLATLRFVGSLPAGSGIIFDYSVSPDLLSPRARAAYDKLAWHVAQSGEPFRAHFDPAKLMADLGNMGFSDVRDYGAGDMNALYFEGRSDRLKAGGFTHLMMAVRG